MWYVMQVQSGREKSVLESCKCLMDEEILTEVFIAKRDVKKRYQGQWHIDKEILFPGYVFIRTSSIEIFLETIRQIPKFTKVLKYDNELLPLNNSDYEYLKRILNKNHELQMSYGVIKGDHVSITSGPMMGMEGSIVKVDRHKRIAFVEIEIFGRKTIVQMGCEIVKKCSKALMNH